MKYTIEKQYDPELDCCLLLHSRYEIRPPESMVEGEIRALAKQRDVPYTVLEKAVASAIELEQYIATHLTAPEEDLQFFFPTREEATGEAGTTFWQLRQRGIRFAELDEAAFLRERAWLLARVAHSTQEKMEQAVDLESLLRVLDESNCTDRTFRICLRLWKDPVDAQSRFDRILDEAASLYREKMDLLPDLNDCSFEAFKQTLNDSTTTLSTYVQSQAGKGPIRFVPSPFPVYTFMAITHGVEHPEVGMVVVVGVWDDKLRTLFSLYNYSASELASDLAAIADQKRLELLSALREGPQNSESLCSRFSLSQALLSYHLNQFTRANVVKMERRGRTNVYSLNTAHLRILVDRIRQYFRLDEQPEEGTRPEEPQAAQ